MAFNGEIYEIFSWLPPKLLYQVSSKSKPCSEFLSENRFIEKQCQNSLRKPQEYLLIQDDSSLSSKARYLRLGALGNNDSLPLIPSTELKGLEKGGRVLASSNGLLLCRTVNNFPKATKFFLCNPVTKNIVYVDPPSEEFVQEWGINVDRVSIVFLCGKNYCKSQSKFPFDYTILLFDINPTLEWSNNYNVYILGEGNNWELKKESLYIGPSGEVDFQNPVYCTNGLYFICDTGGSVVRTINNRDITPYYLLHYDIDHGTSRILALPGIALNGDTGHDKIRIFGWERSKADRSCFESICLVKVKSSEIISIWTLEIGKKKHTESSWSELFDKDKSIRHDLGIKGIISYQPSFAVIEKKFIIAAGRYIYRYCLEDKDDHKAQKMFQLKGDYISGGRLWFNCYSSTLRPCTKSLRA